MQVLLNCREDDLVSMLDAVLFLEKLMTHEKDPGLADTVLVYTLRNLHNMITPLDCADMLNLTVSHLAWLAFAHLVTPERGELSMEEKTELKRMFLFAGGKVPPYLKMDILDVFYPVCVGKKDVLHKYIDTTIIPDMLESEPDTLYVRLVLLIKRDLFIASFFQNPSPIPDNVSRCIKRVHEYYANICAREEYMGETFYNSYVEFLLAATLSPLDTEKYRRFARKDSPSWKEKWQVTHTAGESSFWFNRALNPPRVRDEDEVVDSFFDRDEVGHTVLYNANFGGERLASWLSDRAGDVEQTAMVYHIFDTLCKSSPRAIYDWWKNAVVRVDQVLSLDFQRRQSDMPLVVHLPCWEMVVAYKGTFYQPPKDISPYNYAIAVCAIWLVLVAENGGKVDNTNFSDLCDIFVLADDA